MIAVRRGLAVLAGMLAVAGCGGSEGALSREQFARQANEICVRANEKRRAMASMLSSFARGLGKGGEIARASRAGDDAAFRRNVDAPLDALAQAQTSADRYGLVECARLGRVVR
jgi:hypothetical protein